LAKRILKLARTKEKAKYSNAEKEKLETSSQFKVFHLECSHT